MKNMFLNNKFIGQKKKIKMSTNVIMLQPVKMLFDVCQLPGFINWNSQELSSFDYWIKIIFNQTETNQNR